MKNQFEQVSRLQLEASYRDGKTILSDVSFTSPFKIMRPFYEKKDTMSVMQLMASAGTMAGDQQEINIHVNQGANMEFISQSYEKIHGMEEGFASRTTNIELEAESKLYFNPLPTIPFATSDYRSMIRVNLADSSSKFILSEVLSCGRVAHGEKFQYRRYQNQVEIYENGTIIYRDNIRFIPDEMDMQGIGMYEGFTHLANLLICNEEKSDEWMKQVREILSHQSQMEGGVTKTSTNCVNIKILGMSGEKLVKIQQEILNI